MAGRRKGSMRKRRRRRRRRRRKRSKVRSMNQSLRNLLQPMVINVRKHQDFLS